MQHKFNFDEQDEEGKSILMLILDMELNNEFLWFCLEYFADPNLQDNEGNTALHYAFLKTNRNAIWALLLFNADLEIRNNEENPEEEVQGKTCYEKSDNLFKSDELEKIKEFFNDEFKIHFAQLTRNRRDKIRSIYNEIDNMKTGISADRLSSFNLWINVMNDKNIDKEKAQSYCDVDAKKFIEGSRSFVINSNSSEIYFEEFIIALTRISKSVGIKKLEELFEKFDKAATSGKKIDDMFA